MEIGRLINNADIYHFAKLMGIADMTRLSYDYIYFLWAYELTVCNHFSYFSVLAYTTHVRFM